MAIYKQNTSNKIGTTEQITRMFLDDLDLYGDTSNSLYLQDEAIVIKMLLASYHMDNPDLTVGSYLESVINKKTPSIIAITRAIYRAMDGNLPKYKDKRKQNLDNIQTVRPDTDKIKSLVDKYESDLNRTSMIVQYYVENHGVTKSTRVVDWLDLVSTAEIPSLVFVDLAIMRKQNNDKKLQLED